MTPPDQQVNFKEWLALLFSGLTALFAGLVWWLARKSIEPYFELLVEATGPEGMLAKLSVDNKSRETAFISQIRGHSPLGLLVSPLKTQYKPTEGTVLYLPEWSDSIPCSLSTASGKSGSMPFMLKLPEDRRFETIVSISVRIRRRSRIMPYKIKVITAILPDSSRKQRD